MPKNGRLSRRDLGWLKLESVVFPQHSSIFCSWLIFRIELLSFIDFSCPSLALLHIADKLLMQLLLDTTTRFLEAKWCLWKFYPTTAFSRVYVLIGLFKMGELERRMGREEFYVLHTKYCIRKSCSQKIWLILLIPALSTSILYQHTGKTPLIIECLVGQVP